MGHHKIFTQVWCGVKPEDLPAKFFYPSPKMFGGENLKFHRPSGDPPSIGSAYFETAQHIDKQKIGLSSTTNVIKNGTKLEASPHGVLMHPGE